MPLEKLVPSRVSQRIDDIDLFRFAVALRRRFIQWIGARDIGFEKQLSQLAYVGNDWRANLLVKNICVHFPLHEKKNF